MFLNGKGIISWTTDLNRVSSSCGEKILVLGEYDLSIPNKTNDIMTASILLPPYECTALQLDGNLAEFEHLYTQYLNSPDIRRYFSILFVGLLNGYNFLIYLGNDEAQLPFFGILLNFLNSYYGIIPATIGPNGFIPFQFNYNNPHILENLYEFDHITPNFMLTYYPINLTIPDYVANKLAVDYGLFKPGMDVYHFSQIFTGIRNRHPYGEPVTDCTPIKITGEGKI